MPSRLHWRILKTPWVTSGKWYNWSGEVKISSRIANKTKTSQQILARECGLTTKHGCSWSLSVCRRYCLRDASEKENTYRWKKCALYTVCSYIGRPLRVYLKMFVLIREWDLKNYQEFGALPNPQSLGLLGCDWWNHSYTGLSELKCTPTNPIVWSCNLYQWFALFPWCSPFSGNSPCWLLLMNLPILGGPSTRGAFF